MATNRKRYIISVGPKMEQDIENFYNAYEFPTYSLALQELIAIGLGVIKQEMAQEQEKEKAVVGEKVKEVRKVSGRHYILSKK